MWDLIVSVPDHCLSFYFSNLPMANCVRSRSECFVYKYQRSQYFRPAR